MKYLLGLYPLFRTARYIVASHTKAAPTSNTALAYTLRSFALVFAVLLSSCGDPPLTQFSNATMGTVYSVKITHLPNTLNAKSLQGVIEALLANINLAMSTYRQDSELSQFNFSDSRQPVALSTDLFTVLGKSLEISNASDGAFDITVGPLVNLWGFGPDDAGQTIPSATAIEQALQNTGMQHIHLNIQNKTLYKQNPDVYLDLSAIAKGYGVDKIAEYLDQSGVANYMVEIGGELRVKGINPKGRPWQIAVEKPIVGSREVLTIIAPGDKAVATSGDYRNYLEYDGQRYSHTIDPRNGLPVKHALASVTVIDASCMHADAMATALMVLGPEAGYELAIKENLPVLFITRQGNQLKSRATPEFSPFFANKNH